MPSLFNRPTWAKPHNTNEDEDADVDIFSHSGSFHDIVADQERRKKEKVERKKIKAERRSSGKHAREKDEEKDGLLKKRRITLEDGEALLNSVGLSANFASGTGNGSDDSEGEVTELVRRSPRKNKRHEHLESPLKSSSRRAEVVQNSDDNDDPVIQHVRTVQPPEETESDEEFAELRRKARLQREQSGHNNRHPGNADAATRTSSSVGGAQDHSNKPPILEDEPVVQLFIQSRIPDTKELLVYRKLSQRLEEVRKNWCKKQNFPPEFSPHVFFIHRMRRCYDVTTCKSLGLEVDAFGNLTMKGAEGKEGVEKVHLQAVTQEIYDALLAERDLEAKQRSGELPADDQADAGAEGEDASSEDLYIRVVLVAKNSEDLKLRIKPVSRPISRGGVSVQQLTCCLDYTLLQDRLCIQQATSRGRTKCKARVRRRHTESRGHGAGHGNLRHGHHPRLSHLANAITCNLDIAARRLTFEPTTCALY
jgi:hypothetical protein